MKCGDFRSLEPAAWHDIHSRFGTHLGPKPGVETLDVRCHVMATCQKLRIYKFSFDFVANCCGERWYTAHDKRIILEISYRGMCGDAEAQETGKDQGFRYHLSGRNTGCFKDRSSHYEVIVFEFLRASSYHSFSLEDGFHDYVIRGDKAEDLHVFREHHIIMDY